MCLDDSGALIVIVGMDSVRSSFDSRLSTSSRFASTVLIVSDTGSDCFSSVVGPLSLGSFGLSSGALVVGLMSDFSSISTICSISTISTISSMASATLITFSCASMLMSFGSTVLSNSSGLSASG